jgi:hypothetical protein
MFLVNTILPVNLYKTYCLVFNKATFYDYKLIKYLLEKAEVNDFLCLFETKQSSKGNKKDGHYSKLIVELKSIFDLATMSSILITEFADDQIENDAYFFSAKAKSYLTCNFLGIMINNIFIGRINVSSVIPISLNRKPMLDYDLQLKLVHFNSILKTIQNTDLFNIL